MYIVAVDDVFIIFIFIIIEITIEPPVNTI